MGASGSIKENMEQGECEKVQGKVDSKMLYVVIIIWQWGNFFTTSHVKIYLDLAYNYSL